MHAALQWHWELPSSYTHQHMPCIFFASLTFHLLLLPRI
jgi:hypothetical protein